MKIFLAGIPFAGDGSCIPRFQELFGTQQKPRHELTSDAATADVVLFTECHLIDDWRLTPIAESEVAREYFDKVFVYDERDSPWCRFPGLYVSLPRGASNHWTIATSYYDIAEPSVRGDAGLPGANLLFSFIGSPTAPCRHAIFGLKHPRAVVERVEGFTFYNPASVDFVNRQIRFRQVIRASNFVLCPRGRGTSSIRMYETCAAGRVPVIIADDWIAPPGPDWDSFSVRWPESAVRELPEYLASIERLAPEMGTRARQAHERWFANDISLNDKFDRLAALAAKRKLIEFPKGGIRNAAWLQAGRRHAVGQVRKRVSPLKLKHAAFGGPP